jgi:hypothetical protein
MSRTDSRRKIDPANPKSVLLESLHEMTADESTGSADQGAFH